MGQAKNRGTTAERIRQATERAEDLARAVEHQRELKRIEDEARSLSVQSARQRLAAEARSIRPLSFTDGIAQRGILAGALSELVRRHAVEQSWPDEGI